MIFGWFAGRWLEVQDPVQARLLTDPASLALLEPFIGAEKSVTEAARELGCSVQRLMYRLKQFLAAGLLEQTNQRARAGRPIRLYRSVADGFAVPFEHTPFADLEAMVARQHAPTDALRNRATARRMRELGSGGRRVYRDALSGELHLESDTALLGNPLASHPDVVSNDVTFDLRLSPQDARTFALELREFYARMQARAVPGEGGMRCLVSLGLLPLGSEDPDL